MAATGWFFFVSVLVLAALLFFPVRRLVWVLSMRRHAKLQIASSLTEEAQRKRATRLALILVLLFAFWFNVATLGMP